MRTSTLRQGVTVRRSLNIVGAGLAGSEAAWQAANLGVDVDLFEMRPNRMTEAHQTQHFAELVCSNSFGSDSPHAASRILKDELSLLGSLILKVARQFKVPAGQSLAVDRDLFSGTITEILQKHPRIKLHREEITEIPRGEPCIIATGPLTSESLAASLKSLIGSESLYFYDAISPIVSTDSLDLSQMFFANRYGKGDSEDFLNIPLNREQYEALVNDLITGEVVLPHHFEKERYFEGCMPIEAIAARGPKTLSFGPLKPVGLTDPITGRRPHAVIQLRTENRHRTAYNLVGFQTKLKYPEQLRIFRKLPGMKEAEFLRLGSLHRNTFIDSPRVLSPSLELRGHAGVFVAGQLTGTEGYLESSATGLLAGINAAKIMRSEPHWILPPETMLGALISTISDPARTHFQPMNSNMGVLPPLVPQVREKALRNQRHADRSILALKAFLEERGVHSAVHNTPLATNFIETPPPTN